ncbi:hypothetical protein [Kitasatospora sp. NPDC054795]
MNPDGFHEATVKFTGQGVITATSEVIDDAWNPLHVQLDGTWVHLVKDNTAPAAASDAEYDDACTGAEQTGRQAVAAVTTTAGPLG